LHHNKLQYDVCIVGGGLAGLALSIQLARLGRSVALFEKESYPFHKVCGEYISLECWDFLEELGLPLSSMQLPIIKKLIVSSPNGNKLHQRLPLGGFGISRFFLDNELKKIALANGVAVHEDCKVDDIVFTDETFEIQTSKGAFTSKLCCGTFGKRSNLDVKWKRDFTYQKPNKLNNYIGVKYHIKTSFPTDTIALHNFKNGYCGISKVEGEKYCLCYLTNAAALKKHGSIEALEKNVLYHNPHLKQIFTHSEPLYTSPLTISQISFSTKKQIENHVLLIGDAAGMITPLCGNGMSMALHGSKLAAEVIQDFLLGNITRHQMESTYIKNWKTQFLSRLRVGRFIQKTFGKVWLTNSFIAVMKKVPAITTYLIKQTHGKPF
jgi:flavin-dependent dehydrogenase